MKKTYVLCLIGLLSLGITAWSQAQTAGGTEKAVAALEQQWLQSQKANNVDLVAPLLADKIVITQADGTVLDRTAALAAYKKMKWDSADYTNLKVTVFGNTAIASGGFKSKGTDAAGKPFDNNERWTDTWMKMPGGKWQCVASHSSLVKA